MMLSASVLYFLFLPFFWATNLAPDVDLSLGRVFALFLFGAWVALSLAKRRFVLPEPLILFLVLLFLGTAFLSGLWAAEPAWTLRKAVFLLNSFLLFFVLIGIFVLPSAPFRLSRAFVIGASLAGLAGLVQFGAQFLAGVPRAYALWTSDVLPFFLGSAFSETVREYPSLLVNVSGTTYMRASAFFPDPHLFGLYAALGAALAYGLYRQTGGKRWAYTAVFLGCAVALSFSRGAYLALAAGALFAARALFSSVAFSSRRVLAAFSVFAILAALLIASPVGERARSAFSFSEGSNAARLAIWSEALSHISGHPLFGIGLGNYPREVSPTAGYREPIYAHSLYLDLPLELGLVGASPFFLLLFLAARCLLIRARREPLAEGYLLAVVVFLTHSVFETPIFSVHILPALMLLLAFAFVPAPESTPASSERYT